MYARSERLNERQLSGLSLHLPSGSCKGSSFRRARALLGLQWRHLHPRSQRADTAAERGKSPREPRLRSRFARPVALDRARSGQLGSAAIRVSSAARARWSSLSESAAYPRGPADSAYARRSARTAEADRSSNGTPAPTGVDRAIVGDGDCNTSVALHGASRVQFASYASLGSTAVAGRTGTIGAAFFSAFDIVGPIGATVCAIESPIETSCRAESAVKTCCRTASARSSTHLVAPD